MAEKKRNNDPENTLKLVRIDKADQHLASETVFPELKTIENLWRMRQCQVRAWKPTNLNEPSAKERGQLSIQDYTRSSSMAPKTSATR